MRCTRFASNWLNLKRWVGLAAVMSLSLIHSRYRYSRPHSEKFVAAQNRKSDNEILSPADLSPPASTEPASGSGLQDFPSTLSVRPYTSLTCKQTRKANVSLTAFLP
ncbi:hypothetical protein H9Q72_006860 [Fusarium xylarioides]|uniref:Uncharacterized protein n=1 Tax=Fusarium xylarioides TaxID=221167 RepID=A0A9P7HRC4_9HYPO|nr:hypothetical protein H9Q70_002825 [Fusarium xylarioides]KAG5765062.1 hypothetical protein H9Q72_006860 [Fusarium xylarioides]